MTLTTQTPTARDLDFVQGDTFQTEFTFAGVDYSAHTWEAQIRDYQDFLVAEFTVTDEYGGADTTVTVNLDADDNIHRGFYYWFLTSESEALGRRTWYSGRVRIRRGTT